MYKNPHGLETKFLSFIAAFMFATAFLLIDWEALHGMKFEDRGVYFFVFQGRADIEIEFNKETFFFFLFNEQLWSKGVRWLNTSAGFSLSEIFGGVTFLTVLSYGYFIASRVGVLGIAFLINPIFIDFAYSQLRMAAAMVLVLLAYNSKAKLFIVLLLGMAFFIHTATFLLFFIALCVNFVVKWSDKYEFQNVVSCTLLVFTGFLVALVVGPLRVFILSYLGDRRVNYDIDASTWSYASIWFFILAISYFQERKFFRDYSNAMSVTFLSVFVFCTAFSVYGLRFLSVALPFIFVSLFRFGSVEKPLVVLTFIAFSIVQWIYWVQ